MYTQTRCQVTLRRNETPRDGQDRQHFQEAKLAGKAEGQELVIYVLKGESLAQSPKASRCS